MPPTPTAAESEGQIEPLLSVRDLSVVFELDEGTVRAVDGVSFNVRPGQVVGIVGESGCGKSVTMKAILQLIETPGRISSGEILYRPNGTGSGVIDLARLRLAGAAATPRQQQQSATPQHRQSAHPPLLTRVAGHVSDGVL